MSLDPRLKKAIESIPVADLPLNLGDVAKISSAEDGGIDVETGLALGRIADGLADAVRGVLAEHDNSSAVEISHRIRSHGVQRNLSPLEGVSNIIAVASGKGGVGKSTTAVNLALALADDGARVGVLDADIYGPSQPLMLGLSGESPVSEDGKTMNPLVAHDLQVMSIGFLVDQDQPMVWRGPMVTSALNQLLKQTNWDKLDYLIVDMPPGTGDIALTLSQQVPVSGAVIVTTPQDIALLDARKGLQMFKKVSVPVLGVIENMSTHICSNCGHEEAIFGHGGGATMAADFELPLLGSLPLDAQIRAQTDSGNPTVAQSPDSPQAEAYRHAARMMAATLAQQGRDYSRHFGAIKVENS